MSSITPLMMKAAVEFLTIFGQEYVGGEFDIDYFAIMKYLNSPRFNFVLGWDIETLDDCFKFFEDALIDGEPLWDFLIADPYIKKNLEAGFVSEQQIKENEARKKYRCLRCQNYEKLEGALGMINYCRYKDEKGFNPRKKRNECKGFVENKEESDN